MIRTQQIKLPAELGAQPGLLVFDDDALLAVLGYLAREFYDEDQGKWHVEASFSSRAPKGEVIGDVEQWLERLGQA